jgi:hypothetical protein
MSKRTFKEIVNSLNTVLSELAEKLDEVTTSNSSVILTGSDNTAFNIKEDFKSNNPFILRFKKVGHVNGFAVFIVEFDDKASRSYINTTNGLKNVGRNIYQNPSFVKNENYTDELVSKVIDVTTGNGGLLPDPMSAKL